MIPAGMPDRKHGRTEDATPAPTVSGRRFSDASPDLPATIGGRYEILAFLGMGGMGSVYRVRDLVLDEIVALKFLRRELSGSHGMLARFTREVRVARRVTHNNVARTFDIGEHDGTPYLTMECIDGEPLSAILAQAGAMPARRAVAIGLSIAAGLDAAHAAGVVHRDLKLDNVLVERSGRVVLTDFGVARAVADHVADAKATGVVGTPAYMAPEQVEGRADVDGRADVYALGVVLYELVTGQPAWPGASSFVIAAARLTAPPPDACERALGVSRALGDVIRRCMARRPEDRYPSAGAAAAALREVLGGLPEGDRPRPPSIRRAAAPALGDRTVAVLPFRNAGLAEDDYVAEELGEDLIDTLSMAPGVRVRPYAIVKRAMAADADPRDIGRALDVQAVVDGSIRRTQDAIRIAVRLISVAEGFQLWAKRFECASRDLLVVNDEAARAVAEALTLHITAPPRPAAADSGAMELYLRARQALREGWTGIGERLVEAIELFERGLVRAPDDPGLLSGCAIARARQLNYEDDRPDEPARTRTLIDRTIAIAPHLGEPWLARATLGYVTQDWAGAVAALRAALQRAPSLLKAREMLGLILMEIGRLDDGIAALEGVLALDSTVFLAGLELARGYALAGRWGDADRLLGADPPTDPSARAALLWLRTRVDLWRRRAHYPAPSIEEGIGWIPRVRDQAVTTAALVRGAAWSEAPLAALDVQRQQAPRRSRLRPLMSQLAAEYLGFAGDRDRCLGAIDRAVGDGLFDLSWLDRCPLLDAVRGDARFAALRATVAAAVAPAVAAATAQPG
jgi:eukaryotic-like serine/threonine-protein kinase